MSDLKEAGMLFMRAITSSRIELDGHSGAVEKRIIHNRLIGIYNILDYASKNKPKNYEEALERIERLQELAVSPEIDYILKSGTEGISPEKRESLMAILLIGSNANGGAQIRRLAGTYNLEEGEPDVDSILISTVNNPTQTREYEHFSSEVNALLASNGFKQDRMHMLTFNDRTYFIPETKDEIKKWLTTNSLTILTLLLNPTYPEEFGRKYRRIILETIAELSIEDHDAWSKLISNLKSSFALRLNIGGGEDGSKYFALGTISYKDKKLIQDAITNVVNDLFDLTDLNNIN